MSSRPHVPPVSLADLAAVVGAGAAFDPTGALVPTRDLIGVSLTGVTHDSHDVHGGDLFAALDGAQAHGASFAASAAAAGAVALLTDSRGAELATGSGLPGLIVDDPRSLLGKAAVFVYGSPSQSLTTVGITGTNGKTTTAYLLEAAWRGDGRKTGLMGTVSTHIGNEPIPAARTTPEATDVQALLALMRERGVGSVVMEVSSHALALGRVDGFAYDCVGFTMLSPEHLDFHQDMESYFATKARLFTPSHARAGIVCVDDDWGRRLASTADVPVVTLSMTGRKADYMGDVTSVDEVATRVSVQTPAGLLELSTPMFGSFNATNATLALALAIQTGADPQLAAKGIAECGGVPGRMERVDAGQDFVAIVDFAHTPQAIAEVLRAVRARTSGRVIVVFGAGGDRDRAKRADMGRIASTSADIVVVTDDNPRSEDPAAIREAVLVGTRIGTADTREIGDRRDAIAWAAANAKAGDTVVVAGKGHETGQDVGGVVSDLDDRVELRRAIEERNR